MNGKSPHSPDESSSVEIFYRNYSQIVKRAFEGCRDQNAVRTFYDQACRYLSEYDSLVSSEPPSKIKLALIILEVLDHYWDEVEDLRARRFDGQKEAQVKMVREDAEKKRKKLEAWYQELDEELNALEVIAYRDAQRNRKEVDGTLLFYANTPPANNKGLNAGSGQVKAA